ncbi:exonuclease family protein [Neoconidiobolus thromboides FSU 785]|nr:exonuclease family protein [Neoconidiobolus thromboides FSU 785]
MTEINDPLVWIDCEMSGLNIETDKLLEISVIITDDNLTQTIEGPNLIIKQEKSLLDNMDEWCTTHHKESGLTEKVLQSTITEAKAEEVITEFLKKHIKKEKVALLAGNSVHMDKFFLIKYMPKIIDFLHYRIIDVSVVKELTSRWLPEKSAMAPKKKLNHRALDDILESIEELKFYRKMIFNKD